MEYHFSFGIILLIFFYGGGLFCNASDLIKCVPTDSDGNYSSHEAYGMIYGISEKNTPSEENAIISCSIEGKSDFAKLETIIYGEPPKYLMLEADNEIFSKLNHSTIFCSVSDIKDINRVILEREKSDFTEEVGNFGYRCGDTMTIELQGLNVLSRDRSGLVQSNGMLSDVACVGDADRNGKTHDKLGEPCGNRKRNMFNETGAYVCSKCCVDYFWSVKNKQCEKCGPCSDRKTPNVWTDCNNAECETTTTMSTTTTEPETEKSSTSTPARTSSSKPMRTTTTSTAPPIIITKSPTDLELVKKRNTSIEMKWSAVSGASYTLNIREKDGGFYRSLYSTNTSVNITGLIQGITYQTEVMANNSAGPGPWSPSVSVRTLGTEPKRSPKNVNVVLEGDTLVVSWDGTNKTVIGIEEPLKGYSVELFLNNKRVSIHFVKLGSTSLDIHLRNEGSYTVFVYYHNDIGNGPAVEKSIEYHIEKDGINGTAVFFGVFLILLAVCVPSTRPVFKRLESRYDKRQQSSYQRPVSSSDVVSFGDAQISPPQNDDVPI